MKEWQGVNLEIYNNTKHGSFLVDSQFAKYVWYVRIIKFIKYKWKRNEKNEEKNT